MTLLPKEYWAKGYSIALVDEDAQYKDTHLNRLGTYLTGISIIGDLLLVTTDEMGESEEEEDDDDEEDDEPTI